jgi:cytoskeletal protein RodZ
MHESLGQYLQQARTQKGYSLYDVAMMTCIGYGYLKALEADDFTKLRGQTIAKAYVLAYGRCLALEETEVQKRFAASAAAFYGKPETAENTASVQSGNPLQFGLKQFVSRMKALF